MENVRKVMAEVGKWRRVGIKLLVPDSKLLEIRKQSSTEREKSLALGDYWVNTDPDASWEKLTSVFYWEGEERAAAVTKQYLQQGMCSSLLAEISVYILLKGGLVQLNNTTIPTVWFNHQSMFQVINISISSPISVNIV